MKPIEQEYYLVKVYDYSQSGYAIAIYSESVFTCDATGNDLTDYNPEIIKHLETH